MGTFRDMAGRRVGHWNILGPYKNIGKRISWLCVCACGTRRYVSAGNLQNKSTQNCGCVRNTKLSKRMKTHGKSKTKTFIKWAGMIQRCTNQKSTYYGYYGGRGIKICKRWLTSFKNFYEDMGECPEGLTLDRIDNNKDYSPKNCRWANQTTQARNRRHIKKYLVNGELIAMFEISEKYNIPYSTIRSRVTRGATGENIIFRGTLSWGSLRQTA